MRRTILTRTATAARSTRLTPALHRSWRMESLGGVDHKERSETRIGSNATSPVVRGMSFSPRIGYPSTTTRSLATGNGSRSKGRDIGFEADEVDDALLDDILAPHHTTSNLLGDNLHTPNGLLGKNPLLELLSSNRGQVDDEDEDDNDGEDETAKNEGERLQHELWRKEMDSKKGRGWSDPWDLEHMYDTKIDFDALPDWSPELVSQISNDRVQLYHSRDEESDAGPSRGKSQTIPTLHALSCIPLPMPAPPHPGLGQTKSYALYRKRQQYKYIQARVKEVVTEATIDRIQNLATWEDKQDAVDELYETVELQLKAQEDVLGMNPSFGKWVERAIEEYLRDIQNRAPVAAVTNDSMDKDNETSEDTHSLPVASSTTMNQGEGGTSLEYPTEDDDAHAVPMFMDCYDASDPPNQVVPTILHPLQAHPRTNSGRMVEEWELSAHKKAKRIMLRQSTREVARFVSEGLAAPTTTGDQTPTRPTCVYVDGRLGTGKSTLLASIVAAARNRSDGTIVLYMPDGDRFRKNGFYIEPNSKRAGIFDIPNLSQEVCQALLKNHQEDMKDLTISSAVLEKFFTEAQLSRLPTSTTLSAQADGKDGAKSMVSLLETGAENVALAPMCYAATVDTLMTQTLRPFIIVCDEFNCYYDRGRYFHMDYDDDVKNPIPYNQISLFQPMLDVIGLNITHSEKIGDDVNHTPTFVMTQGALIVATTERHAVTRKTTELLSAAARNQAAADASFHVVEVPRLSPLEVEHMLAHYEATGVGKLRADRGTTVMNDQEVIYLRMVSGGVAQKLMDASMMD